MKKFTTNIERRMPTTGEVICIDRMTSDYAEQHPFDVDGFIEGVYQEFAGTAFEEPREELHRIWTAVMSDTSTRGDASIFPNKNGRKRAAAMKVWHMAGDYWRRGFRLGDTLPDKVPMTRITRLEDGGWIALFPKDMHLLEGTAADPTEGATEETEVDTAEPKAVMEDSQDDGMTAGKEEEVVPALEMTGDDALAGKPLGANSERIDSAAVGAEWFAREEEEEEEDRRAREEEACRAPVGAERFAHEEGSCEDAGMAGETNCIHPLLQTAGYLALASIALLVIWQTGLIIPLGLIGLATGGILK